VPKEKKFEGACPDLIGHVFTVNANKSTQVAKYAVVLDHLKTYAGQKFDSKVQESMETMADVNYVEPQPEGTVTRDTEGNETLVMNRTEEIKYRKMYDSYLADQARLEKKKKQMFAIVYSQMDDEVRAAGKEHPSWETTYQSKDLVMLLQILKTTTFYYKPSQEPILNLLIGKRDFMRVRQKKGQTIVEYHESMKAMIETMESLNLSIHEDEGILEVIAKEHGEDPALLTRQQIVNFMEEGKERMVLDWGRREVCQGARESTA
jgi:hypothetical protein